MRLASRMSRLGTESAFEVLGKAVALQRAGRRVIHLEIGEPDFATPPHVVAAVEQALDAGLTKYVPSPGIMEPREAVSAHLQSVGGMATTPDRVVITPGGKPVMFFTMLALCEPGDEVIYPDPGFPMYSSIADFTGATPVPLPLREENGFRVDPEELARLVTDRTKLLILNSPQNPCGSVLTAEDVEAIAAVAIERDLVVLSDEIYSSLSYSGRCPSVLDVEGMAERTVLLDGWPKTFAMTGFRLGYGVFPPALVEPVTRLMVNSVSCVPAFSQYGTIAALEGPWDAVEQMCEEFRARRTWLSTGSTASRGSPVSRRAAPSTRSRTSPRSACPVTCSRTVSSRTPGWPACRAPRSAPAGRASCGCPTPTRRRTCVRHCARSPSTWAPMRPDVRRSVPGVVIVHKIDVLERRN